MSAIVITIAALHAAPGALAGFATKKIHWVSIASILMCWVVFDFGAGAYSGFDLLGVACGFLIGRTFVPARPACQETLAQRSIISAPSPADSALTAARASPSQRNGVSSTVLALLACFAIAVLSLFGIGLVVDVDLGQFVVPLAFGLAVTFLVGTRITRAWRRPRERRLAPWVPPKRH